MNEQVIQLLENYLDPGTVSRGAVLLTGPWGVGKTHFIKGYLDARAKRLTEIEPTNKLTHLYVSLYGVRTLEEIQAQFFSQTNPMLNSGPVRLLGAVATRAINTLTQSEVIQPGDGAALQGFLRKSLNGILLVFDDLERCSLSIGETMGFINTFVEHEGAKVIILACENEIPNKQRSAYESQKEKLIAKTVEIFPNPLTAYDVFVSELVHDAAKQAAEIGRTKALRVFEASDHKNLRSLRSALHDFDRLIREVDARLRNKPVALERIFLFTIAATLELRSGALNEQELEQICRPAFFYLPSKKSSSNPPEKSRAEILREIAAKYPDVRWSDSIIAPAVLANFYVNGLLDRDAANNAILEHELIVGTSKIPVWRRIWGWSHMRDSEYDELRALFLEELRNHRIVEPGPLLHAMGTLLSLRDSEDDLLEGQNPIDFFRSYLAAVEAADGFQSDAWFSGNADRSSWDGLGFAARDTTEFKGLEALLDEAVERCRTRSLRVQAPELLSRLSSGDGYALLTDNRSDGGYGGVEVLHHIEVSDFADLCIQGGCLNAVLMGYLVRRYHMYGRNLKAEIEWVVNLEAELLLRASNENPPRRKRLPSDIRYWFDGIREDLGIPRSEEDQPPI